MKHKYSVGIVAKLWVDVEIVADSFTDACDQAKKMEAWNVFSEKWLKGKGGVNDGSAKVIQVYDPDFEVQL